MVVAFGALDAALIGALAAVGGAGTTAFTSIVTARHHERAVDRRILREWQTDLLVKGADHLTGGRQNRNVGIAILEGLFANANTPDALRLSAARVLWNQLIYVVEASEEGLGVPHELDNAKRISDCSSCWYKVELTAKRSLVILTRESSSWMTE